MNEKSTPFIVVTERRLWRHEVRPLIGCETLVAAANEEYIREVPCECGMVRWLYMNPEFVMRLQERMGE